MREARLGSASAPELVVLRALKLGDLLVAVPALRALRRAFPEHRIRYLGPAWLEPIVDLVGGIELFDTPGLEAPIAFGGDVDIAVNLHGRGPQSNRRLDALNPHRRIGHHQTDAGGPVWQGPEWLADIHERERWTRMLRWHGIGADPMELYLDPPPVASVYPGAVIVHPGAAYASRQWPVERFAELARAVADAGHEVVLTGSASERERALTVARATGLADEAVLAGSCDLAQMAALVHEAAAVISADTGAAHLASAYRTPSVVLFGPAAPEQWGPPPGPHRVLTDARRRRGDVFADQPDPALLAVGPGDVLAALADLEVL